MKSEDSFAKICDEVAARYDSVRRSIHDYLDKNEPRGEGRGLLRCEIPVSVQRMKNIDRKVEETLQRTIMSLLGIGTPVCWFNEFAVCAGVIGGPRKSVDLVHVSVDRSNWDFIELKEWAAEDEPEAVAEQIQNYFFALSSLVERAVSPYERCRPRSVRLWIMAPQAHFNRYGGTEIYEYRIKDIALAMEPLMKSRKEMLPVSFCSTPLVLDATISKKDFVGMFDKDRMNALIEKKQAAKTPLEILLPKGVELLRSWITIAVKPLDKGMA